MAAPILTGSKTTFSPAESEPMKLNLAHYCRAHKTPDVSGIRLSGPWYPT